MVLLGVFCGCCLSCLSGVVGVVLGLLSFMFDCDVGGVLRV